MFRRSIKKTPRRRPIIRGVAAVFALTLAASTALAFESNSPSWTIAPALVSQYLFRGLRLGGPALQPYVEHGAANYAYGVWASVPLKDRVPGRSDPEIDPYAWYRLPLNAALSLQPGVTVYTYPNADRTRGFHPATVEPNLAVNYLLGGIVLTPKVYYDFVLRGPTAELNAAYAVPLRSLGTELDLNAVAGTYEWRDARADAAPRVKNWGDYWQIGASVPYQIGSSRVSLGAAYARGERNWLKQGTAPKRPNPLSASRLIVTVTYSFTW
jgi:hypothetical protein